MGCTVLDGGSVGGDAGGGPVDAPVAAVDADHTAARLRALGISVEDGRLKALEPFPCVVPGHEHRATIEFVRGHWEYRCEESEARHGLAEVRAFLGYKTIKRLTGVELSRWRERLDYEAGLLVPREVDIAVPRAASPALRRVAEGWRLLVALRGAGDPSKFASGEPFVFARAFVMAWCDVTDEQARRGVEQLERLGMLIRVGQRHRWILWRPGSGASKTLLDQLGSEDALIQAFIEAFDAVELAR